MNKGMRPEPPGPEKTQLITFWVTSKGSTAEGRLGAKFERKAKRVGVPRRPGSGKTEDVGRARVTGTGGPQCKALGKGRGSTQEPPH